MLVCTMFIIGRSILTRSMLCRLEVIATIRIGFRGTFLPHYDLWYSIPMCVQMYGLVISYTGFEWKKDYIPLYSSILCLSSKTFQLRDIEITMYRVNSIVFGSFETTKFIFRTRFCLQKNLLDNKQSWFEKKEYIFKVHTQKVFVKASFCTAKVY